jgi:hypothetical protein
VDTLNGRPDSESRMEGQVVLRLMDPDCETVRARAELTPRRTTPPGRRARPESAGDPAGASAARGRLHQLEEVSEFAMLTGLQKSQ